MTEKAKAKLERTLKKQVISSLIELVDKAILFFEDLNQSISFIDLIYDFNKVNKAYKKAQNEIRLRNLSRKEEDIYLRYADMSFNIFLKFAAFVYQERQECLECGHKGVVKHEDGSFHLCSCIKGKVYNRLFKIKLNYDDIEKIDFNFHEDIKTIPYSFTEEEKAEYDLLDKEFYKLNVKHVLDFCMASRGYKQMLAKERIRQKSFQVMFLKDYKVQIFLNGKEFVGLMPLYIVGALTRMKTTGIYFALRVQKRIKKAWEYNEKELLMMNIVVSEPTEEELATLVDISKEVFEAYIEALSVK